jgi:hypothetical protein
MVNDPSRLQSFTLQVNRATALRSSVAVSQPNHNMPNGRSVANGNVPDSSAGYHNPGTFEP